MHKRRSEFSYALFSCTSAACDLEMPRTVSFSCVGIRTVRVSATAELVV